MVIKNISLEHQGNSYIYRLHTLKLKGLTKNFNNLKLFLEYLFENCPNEYFQQGPRSSMLSFKLKNLKLFNIKGHEICKLIDCLGEEKLSHELVESFLIENDDKTIAAEIPIWLNSEELASYQNLFATKQKLTGHIDLLRIEDNKIWIWDFKPYAEREIRAATQTYFYALMLSKRTNISLDNFRCGYFNRNNSYVFKPELDMVGENVSLVKFI